MDLTQYIDLDSYSSSPGLLGYTDNIPDFSEAGINALCDRFFEKMAAHIGGICTAEIETFQVSVRILSDISLC